MTVARSSEGTRSSERGRGDGVAFELADLCEWRNAGGVELVELGHVVENGVEVASMCRLFFRRQFEMRQFGHALDLFDGNFGSHSSLPIAEFGVDIARR